MKNFKLLMAVAAMTPILTLAEAPYLTTDLTAGGGQGHGTDIGDVVVTNGDTKISVQYIIENAVDLALPPSHPDNLNKWCMTGYHVDIQNEVGDIPQTKKNSPKIGHFGYSSETVPYCTGATVEVPNTWETGDVVAIAAHAEVKKLVGYEADLALEGMWSPNLPEQVDLMIRPGVSTYFQAYISNSNELENKVYQSWCIDAAHDIGLGITYQNVYAVSSYDPEIMDPNSPYATYIAQHIQHPEYLGVVNYMVNMRESGEYPYNVSGVCNFQRAIWQIVSGMDRSCNTDASNDTVIADIITDAMEHVDFEPVCGEKMVIMMFGDPDDVAEQDQANLQTSFIDIPVPCKGVWEDETAWGGPYPGIRFNDKDWSIWFNYEIQPVVE